VGLNQKTAENGNKLCFCLPKIALNFVSSEFTEKFNKKVPALLSRSAVNTKSAFPACIGFNRVRDRGDI
jgi:hypothetical protein